MPPLLAYECKDHVVVLLDGVARATRVAKLLPGQLVQVEIVCAYPDLDESCLPTIAEVLP